MMSSASAIFGSRVTLLPPTSVPSPNHVTGGATPPNLRLMIECSSRPQKKATAHHRKTRPRKSAKWDIKRGPAVYPPMPDLGPEWTLVVDAVATAASEATGAPAGDEAV